MEPQPAETQSPMYLFGGSKPWLPHDWTSSDDRVRGGSSTSHLLIPAAPSPSSAAPPRHPSATFTGTLDTHALGGAGFAAQRTTAADLGLDLRAYTGGIELAIARADGRRYTLVVKDEVLPVGPDGREQSTVSWEAEFAPVVRGEMRGGQEGEGEGEGLKVLLRWEDFKATYRGRERLDAGELRRGEVKRVSIMCRSFFDKQEGDFELVIRSIAAVKEEGEARYRDDPSAQTSTEGRDEKINLVVPARQGWLGWMFGTCVRL